MILLRKRPRRKAVVLEGKKPHGLLVPFAKKGKKKKNKNPATGALSGVGSTGGNSGNSSEQTGTKRPASNRSHCWRRKKGEKKKPSRRIRGQKRQRTKREYWGKKRRNGTALGKEKRWTAIEPGGGGKKRGPRDQGNSKKWDSFEKKAIPGSQMVPHQNGSPNVNRKRGRTRKKFNRVCKKKKKQAQHVNQRRLEVRCAVTVSG